MVKGGREGKEHQCVVAYHVPSTGDLACNPGICPDWESNQQPFGLQPALNPLSYTSQGPLCTLLPKVIYNHAQNHCLIDVININIYSLQKR